MSDPAHAVITPYENGPLIVRGAFEIVDQGGNRLDPGRRVVALCRCGRSRIRPFCDGSHVVGRFHAEGGLSDEARRRHPVLLDREQ